MHRETLSDTNVCSLGCCFAVSDGDGKVKPWSDVIGEAFLDPFGVGAYQGTVTTLGTQGRVASRITQQMPANMPIMTAGTMER